MSKIYKKYKVIDNISTHINYGNYDGIAKGKITLKIDNEVYMLKPVERNQENRVFKDVYSNIISQYNNSTLAEYLSSHIINLLNINNTKAHDTQLVKYNNKLFVACKHFMFNKDKLSNLTFYNIESLMSQTFKTLPDNYLELSVILEFIDKQTFIDKDILKERFWNQFVLDILLLNWDRHLGNWGLLYDSKLSKYFLSPIYDQGSTLWSKIDSKGVKNKNRNTESLPPVGRYISKIENKVSYTSSPITINGRRIKYKTFTKNTDNIYFFKSFNSIYNKLNINKIYLYLEKELSEYPDYLLFFKTLIKTSYNSFILNVFNNKHYKKWLKENHTL